MKKEMTMETRLLIAFALMGVVLIGSSYLIPRTEPPAPAKAETAAKATPGEAPAPATAPTPAPPPAPMPGAITAPSEQTVEIETDLFNVKFSNRGAVVRSWILKQYKDTQGQPLDVVNARALELIGEKALPPPFALAFKQAPSNDPNDDLFIVARSADGLSVTFAFSDGRISARKTFTFQRNSYLLQLETEVLENGVLLPHTLVWRGGFGDNTVANVTNDSYTLYYDEPNQDLVKKRAGDAEDGPFSASGQFAFAGIEDKYFAAVADVPQGAVIELTTFADSVPNAVGQDQKRVGAAFGGSGANRFPLYVGPKDMDTLAAVDPRLRQVIDWGWFFFLAQPLFYALAWTSATLTHNYGWAIVLVTVVINTLLFPLKLSSMKSSRKMQALQPQVAAINEKYKGMSMKDPRKQKQQEELMELYKKNDVNPVGGCLPILLQIPFFFALYKVLNIAIELRGSEWLWISDLSQPEAIAIRILPVLLVVTQIVSQQMTPAPGMDPMQQKMMRYMMPAIFGYMFWFQPAGLVLYWLTGNVVSIAQQWILNRTLPPPAIAVAAAAPAAPKKRK
jgi:YidC/Oxa1 family membrane protein insertase